MIENSLVVGTGKGGTGKTTIATHLAGLWASDGHRVLLVDLDVQGSATRRLAVESDDGKSLFSAYALGQPVVAVEARPRLEVVRAGQMLRELNTLMTTCGLAEAAAKFEAIFVPLRSQYDAIVFDCPPASGVMTDVAMKVSETMLAPSGITLNDREGIDVLAAGLSPEKVDDLVFLGVVLFRVDPRRGRSKDDLAREDFAAKGIHVFESQIRTAVGAMTLAEDMGLLVFEVAEYAEGYAEASVGDRIAGRVPKFPANLPVVAGDFIELGFEVWNRMKRGQAQLRRSPAGV